MKINIYILFLLTFSNFLIGQNGSKYCAYNDFYKESKRSQFLEKSYVLNKTNNLKSSNSIYCLPIIINVIHNDGTSNISEQQILNGIKDLNDAFSNQSYYNSQNGIDTRISFCLAKRDTSNLSTNGINRYVSELTNMSNGVTNKMLSESFSFPSDQYININLVNEVCAGSNCNIIGYAVNSHPIGSIYNGIVMEAEYFGRDKAGTSVIVHEMGHYLGLLHTFHQGCSNTHCLENGDRVCDTPPELTNSLAPCSTIINSCSSDSDDNSINNPFRSISLGGLGDQNDLTDNFMDYIYKECRTTFTKGQSERMRFWIENKFNSLLESKSCLEPCEQIVKSEFNISNDCLELGQTLNIENLSINATNYEWRLENEVISTSELPIIEILNEGEKLLQLKAWNDSSLCDTSYYSLNIEVKCPIIVDFVYRIENNWLIFEQNTNGIYNIEWQLTNSSNFIYESSSSIDSILIGNLDFIELCLNVDNTFCEDTECRLINFLPEGNEICGNGLDDDFDGLVDYFDSDCECIDSLYHANCYTDCEYVPLLNDSLEMTLKWQSDIIGSSTNSLVAGVFSTSENVQIISQKVVQTGSNSSKIDLLKINGNTGITISQNTNTNVSFGRMAIADLDRDGSVEIVNPSGFRISTFDEELNFLQESEEHPFVQTTSFGDLITTTYTVNLADFNGDGIPEFYRMAFIINSDNGKVLLEGKNGTGCNLGYEIDRCARANTVAADLLPSPGLELAAGNTVYEIEINNLNSSLGNQITPIVADPSVTDGFTSVGDIDLDGELDVIVVKEKTFEVDGGIWVWNPRTQQVIASAESSELGGGGVATIGDINADCKPEILVHFVNELRVFSYNGSNSLELLYTIPTTDSSGFIGTTLFDFNLDGNLEIVFRDETTLGIYNGINGNLLSSMEINSISGMEYPIIVDVDNDNQAEILVVGYKDNIEESRIFCFEAKSIPWAPSRSIWNQYAYHVTNVNDDLTIPRQEQSNAVQLIGTENCTNAECSTPYNNFLSQATNRTQEGCIQWSASDLEIKTINWECIGDSIIINLKIDNLSQKEIETNCYQIGIYNDSPLSLSNNIIYNTSCLEVDIFGSIIFPDTISVAIPVSSSNQRLFFTINDFETDISQSNYNQSGFVECNYFNNIDSLLIDEIPQEIDLGEDIIKCESEVFTFNIGSNFESILWSDYSTDSIFSTNFAGQYYVEAFDYCGNEYRDTINIYIDTSLGIDLGPDLEVCPNDETYISVGQEFENINWISFSILSCDSCHQISLTPIENTELIIVAENENCVFSDTINIVVKEPLIEYQDISICEGDFITVNDSILTDNGTYEIPFNGCDSLIVVDLKIISLDTQIIDEVFCEGDSIYFGGDWIKEVGQYSVIKKNINNCDSTIILNFDIVEQLFTTEIIEICDSDSVVLSNQIIKFDTIIQNEHNSTLGCDSIHTTEIIVLESYIQNLEIAICNGDSILLGNDWIKEEQIYLESLTSISGCDSIINYQIELIDSIIIYEDIKNCYGDTILVNGLEIFGDTLIRNVYSSFYGCDSTLVLNISFEPILENIDSIFVCEGDSILLNGIYVKEGFYTDTMVFGNCFKVNNTFIKEWQNDIIEINETICPGDSILIGDNWISNEGIYEIVETSIDGCDSVLVFNIAQEEVLLNEPIIYYNCEDNLNYVNVDIEQGWSVSWSNGSNDVNSTYSNVSEGSVDLLSPEGCLISYNFDLINYQDSINFENFEDLEIKFDESKVIDFLHDRTIWRIQVFVNEVLVCSNCESIEITGDLDQSIRIVYENILTGCINEKTFNLKFIKEEAKIYFPNIFSPNGNGNNDLWKVIIPQAFTFNSCSIFDRWGNMVYNLEGTNIKEVSWDGYTNSNSVEQGVYVYIIKYFNEKNEEQFVYGNFTLIR